MPDTHPISGDLVPELAVFDALMLRCLAEHGVPGAALFNLALGRQGRYLGAAVVELKGNALEHVKEWPSS